MLALIYGGAASGKSEYAEALALTLSASILPLFYVATLSPSDPECIEKINRHRAQRSQKPFLTIECPKRLSKLRLPGQGVVLLECLSTLAAQELFGGDCDREKVVSEILNGISHLLTQSKHVVVVSNSLFCDGRQYDPFTQQYLQLLGELHQRLAASADLVTEVVAGLPVIQKHTSREVLA